MPPHNAKRGLMVHDLLPEGKKERNDRQTQQRKVTREGERGRREARGGGMLVSPEEEEEKYRRVFLTLYCELCESR